MFLKTFFLSAVLSGALLVPAHAQAPVAVQTAPAPQPVRSGYELLVEAQTKLLPGPNGGASSPDANLSPEENLKRERLAVARNAPALALVRQALQQQIDFPRSQGRFESPTFKIGASLRELARQLSQEADVRFADGDYAGALNSKLDTMEMGVAFGRGAVLPMLVGAAIESIGSSAGSNRSTGFETIAAHLDATQCRTAAARIEQIERRRPTFAQVVQADREEALALNVSSLADVQAALRKPDPANKSDYSRKDVEAIEKLSPQTLETNINRAFALVLPNANSPYAQAKPVTLPPDLDPISTMTVSVIQGPSLRFLREMRVVRNRLLECALELRAQKSQSGAYPATFSALPDPFSPELSPLVYGKTPTGYSLYSVGPDGRDDGAKAPVALRRYFDVESGESKTQKIRNRVVFESRGDIIQKPF